MTRNMVGAMLDVTQQDDVLGRGREPRDRHLDVPTKELAGFGGVQRGRAQPLQFLGDRAIHMRQPFRKIGRALKSFHPVNEHSVSAKRRGRSRSNSLPVRRSRLRSADATRILHRAALNTLFQSADADALTLRKNGFGVFVEAEIDAAFPSLEALREELHAEQGLATA